MPRWASRSAAASTWPAVATTVCALVILALVKPLELCLFKRQHSRQMTVVVDHRFTSLAQIEAVVEKMGANVAQLTLMRGEDGNHDSIHFSFVRSVPKAQLLDMMGDLREVEGVREVRI